jgi:hypothetical protein
MSNELQFHPLADIFPLMEGEEFDALVADIKANGLRDPIILYESKILDGRNRYRACIAAGKPLGDILGNFVKGDSRFNDPAAYVISKNIHRRHLTPEQRRDLIAKLIKADPAKSDRQIAAAVKASPTYVGKVRSTVHGGQLPEKRVGKDGKARKQPAKKKAVERKPSQRQLEAEQRREEIRRKADLVATILMERLDRDDLALLYAALEAVDGEALQSAIKERAGINTDAVSFVGGGWEELFENAEHYSDFAENLRKAEIELEAARPTDALADNDPGTILVEDGSVSKPQPSIAAPSPEPTPAFDPWDGLDIPDYLRRAPKAAPDTDDQQKNAKAKVAA